MVNVTVNIFDGVERGCSAVQIHPVTEWPGSDVHVLDTVDPGTAANLWHGLRDLVQAIAADLVSLVFPDFSVANCRGDF